MPQPSIFFNEVNERQGVFTRRAFLLGGVAGVGIGALTGRLAHLQLVQTEQYQKAAQDNQYDTRVIPPPRGLILDRHGAVLASNRGNFRVLVQRDKVENLDATLDVLSEYVPITTTRRRQAKTDPVPLTSVAEDLTWEQFSAVNARLAELPAVSAEMGEVRVYPHGGAFAHVIGYVTKINEEEKKKEGPNPEPLISHPGFRIGKQGVEKALDKELRGRAGGQLVEVDALGRIVGANPAGDIPPIPGKEVVLTLDADVQMRALEVFGTESGSAVMLDCRTGDIICMTSTPSFDANKFVRGLTGAEYRALADYERKPLLDKAMNSTFYPGSTFKPTTGLALLAAGVNPNERVHCGGGLGFGGRFFRCWSSHGSQNLHDAIKNSCDTYFYSMINRCGIDRLAQTARALGYQQKFDSIALQQQRGLIPDNEWVKRARPKDPVWHPGENLSVAIGQIVTANALQMAVATARIANARKAVMPRLIKSIGGVDEPDAPAFEDLPFPPEHMDIVREGMKAVANDPSGTAYRQSQLGLGDIKMAGKTGTAQVRSYDRVGRSMSGVEWKYKDHNLYTAFAPYDDPRYAMAVIVEHGGRGGSTVAAPRAREIMRVALLKDPEIRKRIVNPTALPTVVEPESGPVEGADPGPPVEITLPPPLDPLQ